MEITNEILDRARGVLIGQATGDALGQSYEFGSALSEDEVIVMKAGSVFKRGEWTDDTDQAIAIARGGLEHGFGTHEALQSAAVQFFEWRTNAKDIGIQTRAIMDAIDKSTLERPFVWKSLSERAKKYENDHEKAHGNGSLMRTSPIALGYLAGQPGLMDAARTFSELTHTADLCWQACFIWSEAIRVAVLEGHYEGIWRGIEQLDAESAAFWTKALREAEVADVYLLTPNGYVVTALKLAWAAIKQTEGYEQGQFKAAVEMCIRVGNDTDTTAAICGSLVGARWGDSNIPAEWSDAIHGWPGMKADDLRALATDLVNANFGS